MRKDVNLYKVPGANPTPAVDDDAMDDGEADFPEITIDELIDDVAALSVNDQ